jgi:hypothetical protein
MRYHKLRIAWSVGCGIACVLLIVLWARSYSILDDVSLGIKNGPGYKFISFKGELLACRFGSSEGAVTLGWYHRTVPAEGWSALSERGQSKSLGFAFSASLGWPYMIVLPVWSMFGLMAAIIAGPWIRHINWRFSLGTLLIATTLVAVVLGAIVWLR